MKTVKVEVLVEYDSEADSCYIYLEKDRSFGRPLHTRCVDGDELVHLDFDAAEHLVGIDINDASSRLGEILALAKEEE